ncbi:MAG: metallophosphoesterase [Chlamydia sp.]
MKIEFFTPIVYEKKEYWFQHLHEFAEKSLHLWGKNIYLLSGSIQDKNHKRVEIRTIQESKTQQIALAALKLLSYLTIVAPLLMLTCKIIFRLHLKDIKVEKKSTIAQEKTKGNIAERLSPLPLKKPVYGSSETTDTSFKVCLNEKRNLKKTVEPSPADTSRILKIDEVVPTILDQKRSNSPSQNIESVEAIIPSPLEEPKGKIAQLIDGYTRAWDSVRKCFKLDENSFDTETFIKHLSQYTQKYKKNNVDITEHFGYINKVDLDPEDNPKIYVRADLHGDLKSLIENLKVLKEQNLLDSAYRCKPGVHLIFLGDYCDRGIYGIYILELLSLLREQNENQIHLIRGNHEYVNTNFNYGQNDNLLFKILCNEGQRQALEEFYETMSLSTYVSLKNGKGIREYVQFTHGLFEPTMDLAQLLDSEKPSDYSPVHKIQETLSCRIQKIGPDSPLYKSKQKIETIISSYQKTPGSHGVVETKYNWGDVTMTKSSYGLPGDRQFQLNAEDIIDCLKISSGPNHQVTKIFRGHQHKFQQLKHNNRVVVTTLPVGIDSPYNKQSTNYDRSYIITLIGTIDSWKKQAILRESGSSISRLSKILLIGSNRI